jgi:hypothetical protein
MTASVGMLLPAPASVAAEASEVAKLLVSDGAAAYQFAYSVAVAGDTAVSGVYRAATGASPGRPHLFPVAEPSAGALRASALAVLACLARRGQRRQARCGD